MHLLRIELRSILNALFFMGYGLCEHGHDEGETIYTLASRAREQLAFIEEQVTDLVQIARD
jgi:predicted GNAT superfamily acetyltransferase